MKKKSKGTFSWPQMLLTVVLSVLISAGVWIGFYGVPLLGLPKADEVQSVKLVSPDSDPVTVTDAENVELLVKAANLLNYKFGAPNAADPEQPESYTLRYTLKNGEVRVLSADRTTVWWKDKAHPLKEPDVFYNVLEGLFFSDTTTMQKDK